MDEECRLYIDSITELLGRLGQEDGRFLVQLYTILLRYLEKRGRA